MVCGLTLIALSMFDRTIRWWTRLRWYIGIPLLIAVTVPWFIVITIKSNGDFFTASLGQDFLAKALSGREGKGFPPGYYLLTYWITFAPFAFLSILALPWIWHHRHHKAVRFCIAWIIPTWIVFELVPTKLLHYTLPLFPAIAILTAAAICDSFGHRSDVFKRKILVSSIVAMGSIMIVAMAVALMVILPWLR